MENWLNPLREFLWPSGPHPGRGFRLDDHALKPVVLFLILLVTGPDFLAYVELTTLLELLGATLFIIAFSVGFRLLLINLRAHAKAAVLPRELIEFASSPGPLEWRGFWLGMLAAYWFALSFDCAVPLCLVKEAVGHL